MRIALATYPPCNVVQSPETEAMEVPTTVSDAVTPALSRGQEERSRALRRFNWLTIYLPVGLLALVLILVIVWMLSAGVPDEAIRARSTLSGAADAVIVLASVLPLLLCGILPMALLFVIVQARRQNVAPIKATQRVLWRLETGIVKSHERARNASVRIADPLISAHARVAYILTLAKRIRTSLKRS